MTLRKAAGNSGGFFRRAPDFSEPAPSMIAAGNLAYQLGLTTPLGVSRMADI
jgi:hypothetical protein